VETFRVSYFGSLGKYEHQNSSYYPRRRNFQIFANLTKIDEFELHQERQRFVHGTEIRRNPHN
jgi:hypothetical protein